MKNKMSSSVSFDGSPRSLLCFLNFDRERILRNALKCGDLIHSSTTQLRHRVFPNPGPLEVFLFLQPAPHCGFFLLGSFPCLALNNSSARCIIASFLPLGGFFLLITAIPSFSILEGLSSFFKASFSFPSFPWLTSKTILLRLYR